jgi:hypothetical protein
LEFLHSAHEIRSGTELFHELKGGAQRIERRDLQDSRVAKVDDALVLVFLEQCLKHRARLWTVFSKNIALANVFSPLAPREGRLIKCHMTDKIKGVEVLTDLLSQRV